MPQRRGAAVREAVLAATLAELAEVGFADLGIEGIAARAGVHKTTVYRRWPDRESVVTDAVLDLAGLDFGFPDTGDVDADVRAGLRSLARWLSGPVGAALVSMLQSDAARLPAVAAARRRFFAARAQAMGRRAEIAVAAGQLPAGTDPMRLLSTLVAPIYLDLLVTGAAVTAADCDRAAAIALQAARAGLLS